MIKLQGIYPPIATPFNHKGELYKAKVQHNIEKLNIVNLSGYVVCGSTGESARLVMVDPAPRVRSPDITLHCTPSLVVRHRRYVA